MLLLEESFWHEVDNVGIHEIKISNDRFAMPSFERLIVFNNGPSSENVSKAKEDDWNPSFKHINLLIGPIGTLERFLCNL